MSAISERPNFEIVPPIILDENGDVQAYPSVSAVRGVAANRKVLEKVTIRITRDQAGHIQLFLNKASKSPPNYNLYHSNCAEFCEAAMRAGGLKAPSDVTPGGLLDDLKKLYPQP